MAETTSPMLTSDPVRARPRLFAPPHEVAPGVLLHAAFVNSYAVRTPEGLLLVDPGLADASRSLRDAVRGWSDAPLHTAVYTHGHADHAFGLRAFLEDGDRPRIVAQERCPERFRRYQLTWGWNARINQRQFGLSAPVFPRHFEWPTTTFRDVLSLRFGDLEVRLRAARGETDDACWLWIPERGQLFTGDLVIWSAPNCGNPQKVQRYPVEWAEALEEMAGLGAEWLLPGHGLVVQGQTAVRRVLEETARWLRGLAEQVLARMNAGETPESIVHAVKPDPELSSRPYLQASYDHPQFVVRNLLRLWGGWWDGIPSGLLPASFAEQAREALPGFVWVG
jgi:glyoxylase-like metal-dependent hydrolase (beta-lactamase superfamily II)